MPDETQRAPDWYRDAVIYEVHVRAFSDSNGDGIGDFPGLTSRLDYLQQLGVTAIWLLPFYPSPLRDDGYDIADYYDVHPSYGTLDDFRHFLDEAHARGMQVITELVINHTSDQHPWFQRARRAEPDSPEREFYVWSDSTDRYQDVRIIFQDTEHSNWAWDPVADSYYWHRFFSHQPDLNWENESVRQAVIEVLDFWLDMGVDGLRLDAIPYLHEREGTNGENLPETHEELRRLRAHVDAKYGDRLLLAEANQWPEDAVAYFGDGDECHMSFHFPLMPRLYLALERETRLPIIDILEQTPEIPETAQWAIFLRNHDELTLEMVSEEERDLMWRTYSPDRRARLNLGIRRRLAPLLENDRRRIELLMSLLLSLPGTPVMYYGDELGMGDNVFLEDRDGVRTPMQWSNDRNAGFSKANPQSLYLPVIVDPQYHFETVNVEAQHANPNSLLWWVRRMIRRRRRHPVFGRGSIRFLEPDNTQVLTYVREDADETILVVANLSRHAQFVELDLSEYGGSHLVELLGQTDFPAIGHLPYLLTLGPYAYYWFAIDRPGVANGEDGPLRVDDQLEEFFSSDSPLASRLARYAEQQVWYQGRGRRQLGASLFDAIPVAGAEGEIAGWIALLDIEYVSGHPDRYVLPVAVDFDESSTAPEKANITWVDHGDGTGRVVDALHDSAFCNALRTAVQEGREMLGRTGAVWSRSALDAPTDETTAEPVLLQTAQGESFVQYGPDLTLKLFRTIEPGIHPDLELRRFLTERTSFEKLPPVYGAFEYDSGDNFSLGLMQKDLDPELTAWTLFRDLCVTYLADVGPQETADAVATGSWLVDDEPSPLPEHPALRTAIGHAAALGAMTAEFHQALATYTEEPDLQPVPVTLLYQRSLYQSLRAGVRQELGAIRRLAAQAPEETQDQLNELLAGEKAMLDRIADIRRTAPGGQRIRIHGNYRLDEIRLVDGEFYVLDLSGDHTRPMSERRLKAPPLRDVAEMLRSLDYVALKAAQTTGGEQALARAEHWYRLLGERFVASYLEASAGSPALPSEPEGVDALLAAFELTKALREVHWELLHRPQWIPIAIHGAVRLIS
ncbi:MAG: maltose alpha-D-glucosyltransferase [Acidimicrobiia bacterium]|nr:maltose alpha-D-glucosyltransferase [Acidimicrobiia bacterium]